MALAVGGGAVAWAVGGPVWTAPAVVLVAGLGALALLGRATRRLGGVTGDVLGAVVEVALGAGLVVAVLTR